MAGLLNKPVGIFWDIENCAVPKGKSATAVIAQIRSHFVTNRLNHREFEFLIACDITRLRKDMPEDVNRAGGVTLAHVSGASKNAADEKLRDSMRKFVDTHRIGEATPVLVLISGDIDYVNDLRGYQVRQGCQIILLHSTKCSEQFKIGWNEMYAFEQFCCAVPSNGPGAPPGGGPNQKPKQPPQQQGYNKPGPNGGGGGGPNANANAGKGPHQNQGGGQKQPNQQQNQQANKGSKPPPNQNQPGYSGGNQKQKQNNGGKGQLNNQQGGGGGGGHSQQRQRQDSDSSSTSGGPGPGGGQGQSKNKNKGQGGQPPNVDRVASSFNQMNIHGGQGQGRQGGGPGGPAALAAAAGGGGPGNGPKHPPMPKFILLVMGLPGKVEYMTLKDGLQVYADQVNGKVKYVKNGQAFIGFKSKADAERAIQLFDGMEVFDKKLNVRYTSKIPFENLLDKKLKGAPPPKDFYMVNPNDVPPPSATNVARANNAPGVNEHFERAYAQANASSLKKQQQQQQPLVGGGGQVQGQGSKTPAGFTDQAKGLFNDPSFVGQMAGAMIAEITKQKGNAGKKTGGAPAGKNKTQDSCSIQ